LAEEGVCLDSDCSGDELNYIILKTKWFDKRDYLYVGSLEILSMQHTTKKGLFSKPTRRLNYLAAIGSQKPSLIQ
jgi:hypothetical protein